MVRVTLYSRHGCHLCDDMRAVVAAVGRELPLQVDEVDVDGDPALAAAYGDQVPVLLVNGRKAFKYRVDTAACVLTCARYFRLLKGIRRAALASVYPRHTEYTGQDPLALMLDVGATIRCESEELVQFALMGSAYARRISKVPSPRVALLNMGVEGTKGGETLVAAYRRLRRMPALNFVGNVEGNDLARGRADVVVCEGLLGNVVLKLVEGIADVFTDVASAAARRRLSWRIGLALLARGIERLRQLTDYTQYGGAPILGFENLFIKCHGRSNARAVANAVKVAAKAVRDRVPAEIAEAVAALR